MMKRILVIIFFLSAANLSFSEDITPSKISEVVLFTNQALVKREAEVQVKKGLNEILVESEAFSFDRDSVSARVFGEGEIFSVQSKEVYLKETSQENVKNLEDKIKGLKDKRKESGNKREVLDKKGMFLDSLIQFSQAQLPQDIETKFPEIKNLEGLITFIDKGYSDINKGKEELDSKIEDIDKEITALEKELDSLKSNGGVKEIIEILFNARNDQKIKVDVSYLVYEAWWAPFYKVNVPLNMEEVNLTMFSKINQKTGEDWENVKLAVSNVIPLKGAALPFLDSWFLDTREYWNRKKESLTRAPFMGMKMADKTEEPQENAYLEEEKEADFVSAQRTELPLSFEYQLAGPVSIESKDQDTISPLFSKQLKGEFFHYAVPRQSMPAFLVCRTSADKELLSGMLNVYFGGRFIGKTHLEEKKSGQNFDLNLGADREVKVKREKVKDKLEEKFFGKIERQTVIRETAFKITIENLKDKPVKIKILDSIPVSKTDKIEVKDLKITPKPKEDNYQDKEGVLLWELELKPKEQKDINIEFIITYPKDIQIFGL